MGLTGTLADNTCLVAPGDGPNDGTIIRHGRATGLLAFAWPVVTAVIDSPPIARGRETLEGLVDYGAAAEIGEVSRRPDLARAGVDPGEQPGPEIGDLRLNMIHFWMANRSARDLMIGHAQTSVARIPAHAPPCGILETR